MLSRKPSRSTAETPASIVAEKLSFPHKDCEMQETDSSALEELLTEFQEIIASTFELLPALYDICIPESEYLPAIKEIQATAETDIECSSELNNLVTNLARKYFPCVYSEECDYCLTHSREFTDKCPEQKSQQKSGQEPEQESGQYMYWIYSPGRGTFLSHYS